MAAYLYILWAVEVELVKIGISARLHKRLADHSGNSSNPLEFEQWALYQFATLSDARKIETLVLGCLRKKGYSYKSKRELFKCSPTIVTDIVDASCNQTGTWKLRNFPFSVNEALQKFSDFPCLPTEALELLTVEQKQLYWKGAQDAFWTLSYLQGLAIQRPDFLELFRSVRINEETNSELWTSIIDHYRNHSSLLTSKEYSIEARKIAWAARENVKADRRDAFIDWQELDDEETPKVA